MYICIYVYMYICIYVYMRIVYMYAYIPKPLRASNASTAITGLLHIPTSDWTA